MSISYKALLIGNHIFPNDSNELPTLNGPKNDVAKLKEALTNPKNGLYKEENVQVVLDGDQRTILNAMHNFFVKSTSKDQLLFYYSGHGFIDGMNQLYLCAKDTSQEDIMVSGIANQSLSNMLYKTRSAKKIIILDCCKSGGYKGGDLPSLLEGEGNFVLTSSRGRENAKDADDENSLSPFTKYLVEALNDEGMDTNQDGFVSINEVYEYIYPRLKEETSLRANKLFDDSCGDLPMSKRKVKKQSKKEQSNPTLHATTSIGKPRLDVSVNHIDHRDVCFDEKIPEDIVFIHNAGNGELDWEIKTEFSWIKLKRIDDLSFSVNYEGTRVGRNRGKIRVNDKNGGGSKEIRILIEQLPEEIKSPIKQEVNPIQKSKPKKQSAKLLKSFSNVSMRYPNQAKESNDPTEKSGTLNIYEDRIEHISNINFILSNISKLTYYPQEINHGNPFNYMSIKGETKAGVEQEMYFYAFNWLVSGQTWDMVEELYGYIVHQQMSTSKSFHSHMAQDSRIHGKQTKLPNQHQIYLPGNWTIQIYTFGQVISTLNLAFYEQGTLTGSQQSSDGLSTVNGTWGFNPNNNLFTYYVSITFQNGFVTQDQGSVTLSVSKQILVGRDHLARKWEFFKVS